MFEAAWATALGTIMICVSAGQLYVAGLNVRSWKSFLARLSDTDTLHTELISQ